MAIYLGFDLSTQSVTAIAIEVEGSRREVVFERSLNFDADFPAYGTRNGVLPGDEPLVATSSPVLWADALDRMMGVVATESGLDLSELRAISGSGQQHGSVYLGAAGVRMLGALDPERSLAAQLAGAFARERSPIWMDASTAAQCSEITRALGGPETVARLTGSRAFERFTGPQIRKFYQQDPAGYAATGTIHLVSSFGASLLAGRSAPIDPGDGAGMSLMDLARKRWAPAALDATAPGLERKLPPLGESWTVVGPLAGFWRRRYGFPGAKVVAWSGDNPCSLVGVGLADEGTIAISLGTSDTIFGPMAAARTDPTLSGSVFGSPTGGYMALTVFSNGSLARERIRNEHGLDWEGFARALRETRAGNGGALLLPWFEAEITPNVLTPGARRYGLDPADGPANVRAVVEAQMMALAIHSRWMGVTVKSVYATGGAAANREILQVMADVQGADVRRLKVGNSACLGAALRAFHADELSEGRNVPWREIVAGFVQPEDPAIRPVAGNVPVYAELKEIYAACEAHALRGGPDPGQMIAAFRARQDTAGT
jgi:xylulokinase